MKAIFKNILLTTVTGTVFFIAQSFKFPGEGPVASKTKITNGQTAGVNNVTEFNSGDEIYVCIPLAEPLGEKYMIHFDVEGKQVLYDAVTAYSSESNLKYLSFALAIDPKNYKPDQYFYKEGHYVHVLKEMAALSPGKYQVAFGLGQGITTEYARGGKYKTSRTPDQIYLTINVTEEGRKKWKEWAEELVKMNKEYEEKLKQ